MRSRTLISAMAVSICGLPFTMADDIDDPPISIFAATTSPFAPEPPKDDRNFVIDAGAGLDTGCTFRGGGPLVIRVPVTRYLGPVNADGTLVDADSLVAAGLLSPFALLKMPAYDVDFATPVSPPTQPERDRISFNGEPMQTLYAGNSEFLRGSNNVWRLNTFRIPINKVKFPAARGSNAAPQPAMNEVRIDIDTANTSQSWCTAIDWVHLSIKAASPIIFIHGNSSVGAFYESGTGNAGFLRTNRFIDELVDRKMLYDNSLNFVPNQTSIAANARVLSTFLPRMAKEFGVDSLHVVCHSKGGLDTRQYLAAYQPAFEPPANGSPAEGQFRILSYTSVGTPHNGSVLADLLIAAHRNPRVQAANSKTFENFPSFTEALVDASTANNGHPDLQVSRCATFNRSNLPALPTTTVYQTIAGDMDRNGNGQVDSTPPEWQDLIPDDDQLQTTAGGFAGRTVCNRLYQILRTVQSITITYRTRTVFGRTVWTTAVITGNLASSPLGNDVLVSIPSGLGAGGFAGKVTNTRTLTGAAGRSHSGVGDRSVARIVVPWILDVERTKGDLK